MYSIAFEYEDEDGDRITVRTDEEMSIMISHYQGMLADGMVQPLLIYPRAKPQGRKNMHGLKVQCMNVCFEYINLNLKMTSVKSFKSTRILQFKIVSLSLFFLFLF